MRFKTGIITLLILLAFTIGVFAFSSYGPVVETSYTIAGSTSMQPVIEELAEVYMVQNPSYNISVQGGGSSSGIEAAATGVAALGMSSRPLKPDEPQLKVIHVAKDAIAIIVHPSNPVSDLTLKELRGIFAGKIRDWKELDGKSGKINAVTREEGSGTRGAFEDMVMEKESIDPSAVVQDSSGAVREIVSLDPNSIGFISLGIADRTVKLVSLAGVKPELRNISSKKYDLVRPFIFVYKGKLSSKVKPFIEYVRSDEAADLIRQAGFIPVKGEDVR